MTVNEPVFKLIIYITHLKTAGIKARGEGGAKRLYYETAYNDFKQL